MSTDTSFVRVKKFIAAYWPHDVLHLSDINILDAIWFAPAQAHIDPQSGDLSFSTILLFEQALAIDSSLVDGLKITFGTADLTSEIPVSGSVVSLNNSSNFDVALTVGPLPFSISFDSQLLIPAEVDFTQTPPVYTPKEGEALNVEISGLTVSANLRGELGLQFDSVVSLQPVFIGQTGFVIEAENIGIHLSGDVLPPAMDRNWRGLFMESARIHFPETVASILPNGIDIENASIGSGGISGSFSGEWQTSWDGMTPEGNGAGTLLGIPFALKSLGVSLVQNALSSAAFIGELGLPFFDTVLAVEVSLDAQGAISVAVTDVAEGELITLETPIGTFTLSSIGFVDDEQGTAVLLSGTLQLTVLSPPLQWPAIELQELRIDSDGNVQLPNGWIDLQEPAGFSLFGFGFELTRIGFGNTDDGRRWVGFSGGVQLLPMLPTGASVEGLRIIWNPADPNEPPQLTLQGVGVELTLPGVLNFDGDVAFIEEDEQRYFQGNAKLDIIPIGVGIDASVKIGIGSDLVEDYRYLYSYMDLTLPIGIPLFATGAAIYGFSGLYGMNVGPSAQNSDWYGWYAGPPQQFNVTNSGKWIGENDGKALGAGLTIGTLFDTGRVVSAKGLFALILPGPVIILHGMANFLQTPPDVNDPTSQGVFNMLAVLDMLAGSMQLNIDAGWSKANLIDIGASAEAYFDFANPANWHFYLGKDKPEDRRIRAYMLSLFHADAYLMIDRDGIATGASISWGMDWKFGPVKVVLRSWIGGDAAITWQPTQLSGRLYVGGEFEVSVAGFGVGISAEAELSGATPTAYCVRGLLYLRVKLPTPIKDLEEDILLEWKEEVIPASEDPFRSFGIEHMKVDETWTKLPPDNVEQTSKPGRTDYNPGPIVPLDARPAVVFDRPMKDATDVELNNPGGYDSGYTSTNIDGHVFDYELQDVILQKWSKAGQADWVAVEDLYGTWIAMEDANGEIASSKFQLWTKSPFAFTRQSSRIYRDNFLANNPLWPCAGTQDLATHCVDWDDIDSGLTFPQSFQWKDLYFTIVLADSAVVVNSSSMPSCQNTNALALSGSYVILWVVFPQPVRNVEICINGDFADVKAFGNGVSLEETINPAAGRLSFEATGIDAIALWALDNSEVGSICYQIENEAAAHDATQQHWDRVVANAERWNSEEEILEPETWYKLTVRQETVRTHNGVAYPTAFNHYAYFQTAGPPGLWPPWDIDSGSDTGDGSDNTTLPYPEGGKLTDLREYIMWTIPGNGAKPFYRAYDLGADFNENYIEQMYGADMAVRLLDGNGRPVTDAEGNEVLFPNLWAKQPTGELSEAEIAYTDRVEDCQSLPSMPVIGDQKILFANGVLLEEDFSGDLNQWTDPHADGSSDWAIESGVLIYEGTTFPTLGALLVAGEGDWSDYALEVTLSSQGEEVGLVFRYTGPDKASYYRLRLKAAERLLERVVDGAVTILWQDATGYLPGNSGVLGVQCQGDRLRGQLDNELLFDLRDEEPLLAGQVGIYTNSTAAFEHFLVREWPGGVLAPQTMYRAELMASSVLFSDGLDNGWIDGAFDWVELFKNTARIANIGREEWDDYRVEVNMNLSRGHVGAIVRFQQNPADNTFSCYRLSINPDTEILKLARLEGTYDESNGTYDAEAYVLWSCEGAACKFEFHVHTHDVALTCEGNSLTVEIDGNAYVQKTDNNLATGKAGIYYLGDDDPDFSGLIIRSAPPKPVHQWSFTTSKYPGLVEHIDTFTGTIYTEAADHTDALEFSVAVEAAAAAMDTVLNQWETSRAELAGAGPDELAQKRDETQSAGQKVLETGAEHFNRMYALFFPDTYRPLPPVVEISEITSGQDRLALMVESPEPLDLLRLTGELSRLRPRSGTFVEIEDVLIVWSEDVTRVIVARTGSTAFRPGEYRLLTQQNLDIGLEAPLLRRGGSVLPELAEMRFRLDPVLVSS